MVYLGYRQHEATVSKAAKEAAPKDRIATEDEIQSVADKYNLDPEEIREHRISNVGYAEYGKPRSYGSGEQAYETEIEGRKIRGTKEFVESKIEEARQKEQVMVKPPDQKEDTQQVKFTPYDTGAVYVPIERVERVEPTQYDIFRMGQRGRLELAIRQEPKLTKVEKSVVEIGEAREKLVAKQKEIFKGTETERIPELVGSAGASVILGGATAVGTLVSPKFYTRDIPYMVKHPVKTVVSMGKQAVKDPFGTAGEFFIFGKATKGAGKITKSTFKTTRKVLPSKRVGFEIRSAEEPTTRARIQLTKETGKIYSREYPKLEGQGYIMAQETVSARRFKVLVEKKPIDIKVIGVKKGSRLGSGYLTESTYEVVSKIGKERKVDKFFGEGVEVDIPKGVLGFEVITKSPKRFSYTVYRGEKLLETGIPRGDEIGLSRYLYKTETTDYRITPKGYFRQVGDVVRSKDIVKEKTLTSMFEGMPIDVGVRKTAESMSVNIRRLDKFKFKVPKIEGIKGTKRDIGLLKESFYRRKDISDSGVVLESLKKREKVRTSLYAEPTPLVGYTVKKHIQPTVFKTTTEPKPKVEPTLLPPTRQQLETYPLIEPEVEYRITPTLEPKVEKRLMPIEESIFKPVIKPTLKPSIKPSLKPSLKPQLKPSLKPSLKPQLKPSLKPMLKPQLKPSLKPTLKPILKPQIIPRTPPPTLLLYHKKQVMYEKPIKKKKYKKVSLFGRYQPQLTAAAFKKFGKRPDVMTGIGFERPIVRI